MSLSSTRGLVRISINPKCEFQAAMVAEGVREPELFRRVTGREYDREYGERASARRRGAKFEENLCMNNAALLRSALAPVYGYNPEEMVVRNFADEVPGVKGVRVIRLNRTRQILRDLAAGNEVPHLLIQPQLSLPIEFDRSFIEYVAPDFMVLDGRENIYRPGEMKSFIVREGRADKADLNLTRRQAAAQILALRSECGPFNLAGQVTSAATFIFATPYGLSPAKAFEEVLEGPIREIGRAIEVLRAARRLLEARRQQDGARLEMLYDEIPVSFQESCFGSCIMAGECKKKMAASGRVLGDEIGDLLGGEISLERAVELLGGAEPESPAEREIAERLSDGAAILGSTEPGSGRRVA
jgi:hypothetical protein